MSGETQRNESGWTVDTLKEKLETDIANLEKFMLQQVKDIRDDYNQRFDAQEKGILTAFDAAKEAVTKSEISVEKRGDAVYVSIAKLQGALADVMPRKEAEERFKSLTGSVAELRDKVKSAEGADRGAQLTTGKMITGLGVVLTILTIIVLLANNVF